MTRWGIGPKWALASLACAVPLVIVGRVWPGALTIGLVPRAVQIIAGVLLVALGIPFAVAALVTFHRGFGHGKLSTGGVYGLCRHPIYASWIVFLVPGILLLAGSWAFLPLPTLMYLLLLHFVRDEEKWLAATFGEEYQAYRRRVPAVFPLRRFWR
jgi:protein-S-isoprenylcysteine O-methyltransferase Ste14